MAIGGEVVIFEVDDTKLVKRKYNIYMNKLLELENIFTMKNVQTVEEEKRGAVIGKERYLKFFFDDGTLSIT